MPETPDLQVIKEVLDRRVVGHRIDTIEVLKPIVVRSLQPDITPQAFLEGAALAEVQRRGKFLLLRLQDAGPTRWLVVNFMLVGHFRYCERARRPLKTDYLLLHLDDGHDLRYNDARTMGKLYLTYGLDLVPGFTEMGPDVLDPDLTLELFLQRLKSYRGEIKGILCRESLVSGIGNAYADEILFRAGIYPFRKRTSLSLEEQTTLYHAMRDVLVESIEIVRERTGEEIHLKVRDFLAVHNKKGQPCPRCGRPISEVNVDKRATSFCRACQPGTLVSN